MPASVVYPKSPQGIAVAATAGRRAGPRQFSSANQLILFFYLLGYNNVSFMGWFWVLYTTLFCYVSDGFKHDNVHELSWQGLMIVQSAAILEVIHSACGMAEETSGVPKSSHASISSDSVGFVRAPTFTTAIQVQTHWAFVTMTLAWSLAECVRYAYYGTSLIGNVPLGLTWVRYNAFFILYPFGVASELMLIYQALPYANEWNPAYRFFITAVALAYIPGFAIMFIHMQRRKYLKGSYLAAEKKKLK